MLHLRRPHHFDDARGAGQLSMRALCALTRASHALLCALIRAPPSCFDSSTAFLHLGSIRWKWQIYFRLAQCGGDGQICSGLGDPRHCRSLGWLVSARPSPYPRSNSSGSSFASLQLSLRESLRVLRPVETSWSHALVRVDEALSWPRVPCATFMRYVAMAITVFEPMCVSIWWSILCSGQRRHCDSFTTDSPLS